MKLRYTLAFLLSTIIAFASFVTVHDLRFVDFTLLPGAARAHGKVLLFGNSINRTLSRCDQDKRTLPDMLSALGGPAVVNVSRGGMQLSQMLHVADVVTRVGVKPSMVVFPLFFSDLVQPGSTPYGFDAFAAANFPRSTQLAAARSAEIYKGVQYGSYGDFSKTFFQREKSAARCPEPLGTDLAFVEFMYWRSFLQSNDPLAGLQDTINRAMLLRQRGVRVAFWFVPVDVGDLRTLHGNAAVEDVRLRVGMLSATLRQHRFIVVDTTEILPATAFADRWCACGHLGQEGRLVLAGRLLKEFAALAAMDPKP